MAELARLLVDADPDEQAALNEMASRLMTDQLVRAAKELREATHLGVEERIPLLKQIAVPITQAQRAAVYARRWSAEQLQAAAAAAGEAAKAAGLDDRAAAGISAATLERIRREVLGMA